MTSTRLILVLLAGALAVLGLMADFTLRRGEALSVELAQSEARGQARLLSAQVRARLAELEEDAVAGRDREGLSVESLSPPPGRQLGVERQGFEQRPVAVLVQALDESGVSATALPVPVLAALALGQPEQEADQLRRLLAGQLSVDPGDLSYLARALGGVEESRVASLRHRLERAPRPRDLPAVPSFRRRATATGVEGWARVGPTLLRYEATRQALLLAPSFPGMEDEAAGAEPGRVRLTRGFSGTAEDSPTSDAGWLRVSVPAVPGLLLEVPLELGEVGSSGKRALSWLGMGLTFVLTLLFARAIEAEARAVARERSFLGAITHELRTPLATVRVLGETLAAGRGEPAEYGRLIAQESERLDALVDRVLAMTRLEEAPEFHALDLVVVVDEAVALLRPRAEGQGVRLDWVRPEQPVLVHWDREAVRRALLGLLDNALRHGCPSGGQVRVSLALTVERVSVVVSDDGPGIRAKERRGIFERFARSGPTGGTGLGLHLVEQVARAHGGSVELKTEKGQGATFSLSLPLRPPGFRDVGGDAS